MDISYLGHAAFKLKGKEAVVVTDPFEKKAVGFAMPQVSADLITVSHGHEDHNAIKQVTGTSRRAEPYVITAPGEYEVNGVGVFGWGSFHDDVLGAERGKNTIFSIMIDGVRIVHLGDLGTSLKDDLVEDLGTIDVLLVPVGGVWTIGAKEAQVVIEQLSPSLVIPMHYRTDEHTGEYTQLAGVEEFLKLMGVAELQPVDKLKITSESLPEESQIVWLKRT